MKTGLSLDQMATELARRNSAKRDYVLDTRAITFRGGNEILLGDKISTVPNKVFVEQAAQQAQVPIEYARRIRETQPGLFAETFNTLLWAQPKRRMVRTLDNTARALLSDRYRPLDNYDLAQAVLPALMDIPGIRFDSAQFTDDRFYLKAVLPRIETEVKVGDAVQIGLLVENSEVGRGSLKVLPLIYRLVCKNGMVCPDYGQRSYHVGRRRGSDDEGLDVAELYSDKTRELDDRAFFAKVTDTVKGVMTRDVLDRIVAKMREATEQPIDGNPLEVVEVTARKFGYSKETADGILQHLIRGGDLSRYGLMNAITRQAQDEDSFDDSVRLEADGARLIELPKTEWRALAKAA
jgi:hypothetical protein